MEIYLMLIGVRNHPNLGTPNDPARLNKNDANSGEINEFVKHYYPEIK